MAHLPLMLCLLSAQDAGRSWLSCELMSDPEVTKFDAVLEQHSMANRRQCADQSWRAPWMIWTQCGISAATASSDSTAPVGLPGRLRISVLPQMAAMPRDKMARGVCSMPFRR